MGGLKEIIEYQNSREHAVIGSLLMDISLAEGITDYLPVDAFSNPVMRAAYRAITALLATGNSTPSITEVGSWIEDAGIRNQWAALASTTDFAYKNAYPAISDMEAIAKAIHDCNERRAILAKLESTARMVETLGNELDDSLDSLTEFIADRGNQGSWEVESISDIMRSGEALKSMGVCRQPGTLGIPTGMTPIDRVIGGFQQGELIVIAARPGVGKTSVAVNIMDHLATTEKISVGLISMEMSKTQIISRAIFSHARVAKAAIRSGYATQDDEEKVIRAIDDLSRAPIYIDEPRSSAGHSLRSKIRRMASKAKCSCVFLDYVQLISSADRKLNRNEQISEFTRSMKLLARELKIPIVLLSQLRRDDGKSKGKPQPPTLESLRDSGAIEADADIVILLHRPYFGRPGSTAEETKLTKMIIAKNRDGQTGEPSMYFEEGWTRFEEYPVGSAEKLHRNYYENGESEVN